MTSAATMDDETFERLSSLNDQLIQVCAKLHDVRDVATASRLISIADDLTQLIVESNI